MNRQSILSKPHLGIALAFSFLVAPAPGGCNDLNDGIPLDTPIDDSLQTGINIPFILMKAKGRELSGKRKSKTIISDKNSAVGQGNIILGPGANIAPGTIIINNSEIRDSTTISK